MKRVLCLSALVLGIFINGAGAEVTVDLKIGTDVQDREVVGVADSFSTDDGTLVGWNLIKGAEEPVVFYHVWSHEGQEVANVELQIKSSNFRTWSRKTLWGLSGEWKLEVKDSAGTVLASKTIQVIKGSGAAGSGE